MSRFTSLLLFLLLLSFSKTYSQGQFPPGFAASRVVTGLDPVAMALTGDGRVFIAEKFGKVSIVENGQLQSEPFLEVDVDINSERGLCGIAIDPEFETNSFVYIYYTVKDENHNRVSRFTADGNFAVQGSETILLELDELTGPFHNAGNMVFGIDGKLYLTAGDGTNINNPQKLTTLLGKILRINKDGTIPEDNPFYNETTGKYRAIWAIGHRNPFAINMEPSTGRIFTTDVGGDDYEEVNEIFKGQNYGWPLIEGPLGGQVPPANYQEPLYAYHHDLGCAAVGVAFYDPAEAMFPASYVGKLFFTEMCKGIIFMMDPATGEVEPFGTGFTIPLGLTVAPDGTMFMLDRSGAEGFATSQGSLWQIFYTGSNEPFISIQPQSTLVPEGEDAIFSVSASGEEPLTYQWQLEGIDVPGADRHELTLENPLIADSGKVVRCIVGNPFGVVVSNEAVLNVTTSQRPVPEIISPLASRLYKAGETFELKGEAFDPEQGIMPATAFRWRVDFHHNEHTHPAFGPLNGVDEALFEIPQNGETSHNVFYRIYLTVTDESGLDQTITQDIFPQKSDVHIFSEPSGFPLRINEDLTQTPDSLTSVVGIFHQITAYKSFIANDSLYLFKNWASGETENSIQLAPPVEGVSKTAIYEAVSPKGEGQGLRGYYYDRKNPEFTFVDPFEFERIDSVINFDWTNNSPNVDLLGEDQFLVRWEGGIKPFFDEVLNLHFIVEDGMRCWLDDNLLIDRWHLNFGELLISLSLTGEKMYKIKLEYFQGNWRSYFKMFWSSEKLEKDFVPSSRLFPEFIRDTTITYDELNVKVRPNPVSDELRVEIEGLEIETIQLDLFNLNGQLFSTREVTLLPGLTSVSIDMSNFPTGEYFLRYRSEHHTETFPVSKL